jgi:hypothetical protein
MKQTAEQYTSPALRERSWSVSDAGEGATDSNCVPTFPHPALRADLSRKAGEVYLPPLTLRRPTTNAAPAVATSSSTDVPPSVAATPSAR